MSVRLLALSFCYRTQYPPLVRFNISCLLQSLELWNPTENSKTWSVPAHSGLIAALTDSPQTEMVASASNDHCVKLWKWVFSACTGLCTSVWTCTGFVNRVDSFPLNFVSLGRVKISNTARISFTRNRCHGYRWTFSIVIQKKQVKGWVYLFLDSI